MNQPLHSDHDAGPWLEDARRILTLIETSAQQHATQAEQAPGGECAWCPLCQALSLARRSAPDLLDRVAELASGLAATIRATQPDQPDQPTQPDPPGPPETVRIDITD